MQTYTMNYNSKTATVDATINGIHVASESSYLNCEAVVKPLREAVAEASAFLATLMNPPAAKPAKPAKKARKTKAACTCVACRVDADAIRNGVFYCAAGKEWYAYDYGHLVGVFAKNERLEAEAAQRNARYERLRRAA